MIKNINSGTKFDIEYLNLFYLQARRTRNNLFVLVALTIFFATVDILEITSGFVVCIHYLQTYVTTLLSIYSTIGFNSIKSNFILLQCLFNDNIYC